MYNDALQMKIAVELDLAEKKRREGFEGKARVCARRAAGLAIEAYFERLGMPGANRTLYDLILTFKDLPGISPRLRSCAEMLSIRVNQDHQLPPGFDLIAAARTLVQELK